MPREILQSYLDEGLHLVRYSREKIPIDKKWNKPEVYSRIGVDEAEAHLRNGGFIGVIVPDGVIIIDVDRPDSIAWLESRITELLAAGHRIQKTPHGYHLWAKDPGGIKPDTTKTPAGEVTFRTAGKSAVIVAPSAGRRWL